MFTEAVRAFLVSLGIEDAENWTKEQLLNHVDNVFAETSRKCSESIFAYVADEFLTNVKANLCTVDDVIRN